MEINRDMIRESVRGQVKHQLNEGHTQMVAEGMFQRLMAKGTDKFQFMFLENKEQDTRYLMSKDDKGNIQWHMFIGKRHIDTGKFMNDAEVYAFIDEKKDDGFKMVNKKGGIANFFRAVGRGIGFLITVHGITTLVGALIVLALAVLDPTLVSGIFGPQGMAVVGAMYGGAAVAGALTATAGWVTMKMTKKQDVPEVPTGEPNPV